MGDPWLDVFPVKVALDFRIVLPGPADQKNGAGFGSCLVLDMQTALSLGIDRPGGGDEKACLHQTGGQRVPGAARLVGEHQGHDAVRLQHPAALGEDGRHALLVVPTRQCPGALLSLEPGGIGDGFIVLVGQAVAEQVGEDVTGGAFEPDVEEVRQLGIHDVVIIRRVDDHRVDAAILNMIEVVSRFAGNVDWRGFVRGSRIGRRWRLWLRDVSA